MLNKNVASELVTLDRVLSNKPCWLHYAYLIPSGAVTDTSLYDGHNTSGQLIVTLKSAVVTNHEFRPAQPVYCKEGLFVDIGSNTTGVFVQWENAE
jgi:hypothetical protein